MLLGRVKSRKDPRTLQLRSYVAVDKLPSPPAANMFDTTTLWPMLANDRFNCCTSAAAGHMVHHWTAVNNCGVYLTDDDIIRAHAVLTGDRLMETVSMSDALKFWRKNGIGDHRVHSYICAGHCSSADLRAIIFLFGAAYLGLDLPHFAYTGDPQTIPSIPWEIPQDLPAEDTVPLPGNGHCVAVIGYDQQMIYAVSWGRLKSMSWEFFERYTDELYAVLSEDWVRQDRCPSGFDMSTLKRDLACVSASPAA